MGSPSLRFAPYSTLAALIADRLAWTRVAADPLQAWPEEVIVASNGVAQAITARLLERLPNGLAGLRLHSVETFATEVVNPRASSRGWRTRPSGGWRCESVEGGQSFVSMVFYIR